MHHMNKNKVGIVILVNLEIPVRKKISTSFLTTTLKLSIVPNLICVIFFNFVVILYWFCLILGFNLVQLKGCAIGGCIRIII